MTVNVRNRSITAADMKNSRITQSPTAKSVIQEVE